MAYLNLFAEEYSRTFTYDVNANSHKYINFSDLFMAYLYLFAEEYSRMTYNANSQAFINFSILLLTYIYVYKIIPDVIENT